MEALEQLQALNVDRIDFDEQIFLLVMAEQAKAKFEGFGVPSPSWLAEAIGTLTEEIKRKRRDQLALQLKQARQKREKLKTAEEKRADTDAEITRLEQALSGAA